MKQESNDFEGPLTLRLAFALGLLDVDFLKKGFDFHGPKVLWGSIRLPDLAMLVSARPYVFELVSAPIVRSGDAIAFDRVVTCF